MSWLTFYLALVVSVGVQRLLEVQKAKRNMKRLLLRGGFEVGKSHYPAMVAMHTCWLLGCIVESLWRESPPTPWISIIGVLLLVTGQCLRLLAMSALGERWTTRIIVVPGMQMIESGIFKKLRHPNYLGVALEIIALPLIFGNWISLIIFSIMNAILMAIRIPLEEKALQQAGIRT